MSILVTNAMGGRPAGVGAPVVAFAVQRAYGIANASGDGAVMGLGLRITELLTNLCVVFCKCKGANVVQTGLGGKTGISRKPFNDGFL